MEIDPERHARLQAPFGRGLSGFTVGLLHLAGSYPVLPGNPQNASTFEFPVLYEEVLGAEAGPLMCGDPALTAPIVAAAHRLEAAGVGAIVGVCGSFAYYQRELAQACSTPVFGSVLCLSELVAQTLPRRQQLLLVFADTASDTPRLREACGIVSHDRIATTGCQDLPAFRRLFEPGVVFDPEPLRRELLQRIEAACAATPGVGAIILQCSELAPFAADIQERFGLPIYDGAVLVRFVHASLARHRHTGFMTRGAVGP